MESEGTTAKLSDAPFRSSYSPGCVPGSSCRSGERLSAIRLAWGRVCNRGDLLALGRIRSGHTLDVNFSPNYRESPSPCGHRCSATRRCAGRNLPSFATGTTPLSIGGTTIAARSRECSTPAVHLCPSDWNPTPWQNGRKRMTHSSTRLLGKPLDIHGHRVDDHSGATSPEVTRAVW